MATTASASTPPPPRWLLIAALIVVQLVFGGYGIVIKAFAEKAHINALFFSMCRDICCFPVLLLAASLTEELRIPRLDEVPLFFFLGLSGMFSNQIFYIWGLYYTSPNVASIFQPVIPVFTALLAYLTCFERITCDKIGAYKQAGILCATGGAAVMIASKGVHSGKGGHNFIVGNLFLCVNTFSMAGYMLVQKKFIFTPGHRYHVWAKHPVSVTAWAYFFGALCMSLAATYYVKHDPGVFNFTRELWIPLVYSILLSSALAYGLLTWANKYLSPTVVTAFWPVQVPATVIMSWIFFQQDLTWLQGVGGVLIAGGLFMVTYSNQLSMDAAAAAADSDVIHSEVTVKRNGYGVGRPTAAYGTATTLAANHTEYTPILTSVVGPDTS